MGKLLNLKFKEDIRGFKKDEIIEFKKLTVLVGDNGCGKSTLLDLIRCNLNIRKTWKSALNMESAEINFDGEKPTSIFSRDFHAEDLKYQGFFDKNISLQVQTMYISSGQSAMMQLKSFGLQKMTDSLIILDEPERNFSLNVQRQFGHLLATMCANGNQVIMSTHSSEIIDAVDAMGYAIYNVIDRQYINVPEYLNNHLTFKSLRETLNKTNQ